MNKTLLVVVSLLLMAGIAAQAQNTIDRQGRKQGHWIKTDKDGSKIFEGDFKDGQEVGTFRYFYPDGTVRIINEFEPGTKRCKHEAFDEKGRKLATGYYDQKNRDGEWQFYAEDGRLVKIANYKMGIRQGRQVIFDAKGDTAEVSTWNNNHRHGRWWRRIGKKGYITGTYKEGGLHGVVEEYDDTLRLVSRGNYRNGLRHGKYEYYEEGKLSVIEQWEDDNMQSRRIRIMIPQEEFISMFDIAYLVPKGRNKVLLYTMEGKSIDTYEPADNLYYRLGNEHFFMANKKSRIMVSNNTIMGIVREPGSNGEEGGYYLDVDPKPDFKIYPDEDCIKAVESLLREEDEGLNEKE